MMHNPAEAQRRLILEQFTRQAIPFSEMPAHSRDDANQLLIEVAQVGPVDTVLAAMGFVAGALVGFARRPARPKRQLYA